ncbi:ciliary protein causing Leber congenital amaurosis disease-domain-containing protein [Zopfochytrium polystomum]|nr:ciliary protein causing Leber congenital amaurosis disease-domain-containing protein [Zopfochytrium polystomum]
MGGPTDGHHCGVKVFDARQFHREHQSVMHDEGGVGEDHAQERARIYGKSTPAAGKVSLHHTQQPGPATSEPRMQSAGARAHPDFCHTANLPRVSGQAPIDDRARRLLTASHINLILEQMDKLRVLMREKDVDLLKLRHENVLLKQIERRQQRDLEQLDSQTHDAPRLIKGLRDEITGLKSKLKVYFTQMNADSRQIRALNEERRKLQDHISKLESLAAAKKLYDNEKLAKQLSEMEKRLNAQERVATDAVHRCEMVDRNLNGENRQLRGKIHNLETEGGFLKEKIGQLEEKIREKEKEIASLSIYRYNAVHKKVEVLTSCKKCEKREKEEHDTKKKQAILEKLPALDQPSVELASNGTVKMSVKMPREGQYSRIVLELSSDMSFTNSKTWRLAQGESKNTMMEVVANGLEAGKYYYIQAHAGHEDVDGPRTTPVSILVDSVPTRPLRPTVTTRLVPPTAFVHITVLQDFTTFSEPSHYSIYHSNDGFTKDSFLIGEVKVSTADQEDLVFEYTNARFGEPHYFRVAAVNGMGMGEQSEVSDVIVLDCRTKPKKPVAKKLSSSSVLLSSSVDKNSAAAVDKWKVLITQTERPEAEVGTVVLSQSGPSLEHAINGLEPGGTYSFSVIAVTAFGESEQSDPSDDVNLDHVLPIPEPPRFESITGTSLTVLFQEDALGEDAAILTKKRIILTSLSEEPASTIVDCELSDTSFHFENLAPGTSYAVSVAFVSGSEEGAPSDSKYISLAAAFPLPPSPVPSTVPEVEPQTNEVPTLEPSRNSIVEDTTTSPAPLSKATSRSLSLTQRMQNMHDGNPAHHDPDARPGQK